MCYTHIWHFLFLFPFRLSIEYRCPPGSYCPDKKTTFPQPCPKNYKCGPNTIVPQKCGFLSHSQVGLIWLHILNLMSFLSLLTFLSRFLLFFASFLQESSSKCHESVLFYVLIFILFGIVIIVVFGSYKYITRPSPSQQEEKQGLIPRSLPGPVYGTKISFLYFFFHFVS